jgi:hypothetical protein
MVREIRIRLSPEQLADLLSGEVFLEARAQLLADASWQSDHQIGD